MSAGLLAWIRRDSLPVDAPVFHRVLDSMQHRGHDGCDRLVLGQIALGQQNFYLSPFSRALPFRCPQSGLCIALDGRLSRREELAAVLGLRPKEPTMLSDAELVLKAYLKWGTRWVEHTRGAVAAIIVAPSSNLVVCSRDALGQYPLYYHISDRLVIVASEPQAILRHPDVRPALDPLWAATFFSLYAGSLGNHTPFSAIQTLDPGETLVWSPDKIRFHRFTGSFGTRAIRYSKDEEYAEHYRDLLSHSIREIVVGNDAIGSMLSGGMDSCPATSLAAEILGDTDQTLTAYSWSLRGFPQSDETIQIRACADHAGVPLRLFPADGIWSEREPVDWPITLNSPQSNPFLGLLLLLFSAASRDKCRILLNSAFGDCLHPLSKHWLYEAVVDGRLNIIREGLAQFIQAHGFSALPSSAGIRYLVQRLLHYPGRRRTAPEWLSPSAAGRLDLTAAADPATPHARPQQYRHLIGPDVPALHFANTTTADCFAIALSDPYHDWELIDFMLSIPAYQCFRVGSFKHIARESMRGVIPEEIRTRPRGGLLDSFLRAGFQRYRPAIRRFLGVPDRQTWRRFVRIEIVEHIFREDVAAEDNDLLIWQVFCFELWLERLHSEGIDAYIDWR